MPETPNHRARSVRERYSAPEADCDCQAFGFAPDNCLVVGDDPTHDMEAARRGGFPACRVMSGRFATLASPPEFAHLPHLPNVLDLPQHLAISGSAT